MKPDMVSVTWADAHSDSSGWTGHKELDDEGEYLVHSVGWLLTESMGGKPGHLTICQSYTPDEDVDHVLYVPNGMVRKVDVLTAIESKLGGYHDGI
jgi:uncharacterized protein YndB with AHSA1/START domain